MLNVFIKMIIMGRQNCHGDIKTTSGFKCVYESSYRFHDYPVSIGCGTFLDSHSFYKALNLIQIRKIRLNFKTESTNKECGHKKKKMFFVDL